METQAGSDGHLLSLQMEASEQGWPVDEVVHRSEVSRERWTALASAPHSSGAPQTFRPLAASPLSTRRAPRQTLAGRTAHSRGPCMDETSDWGDSKMD